jgi:hypothetical protein
MMVGVILVIKFTMLFDSRSNSLSLHRKRFFNVCKQVRKIEGSDITEALSSRLTFRTGSLWFVPNETIEIIVVRKLLRFFHMLKVALLLPESPYFHSLLSRATRVLNNPINGLRRN